MEPEARPERFQCRAQAARRFYLGKLEEVEGETTRSGEPRRAQQPSLWPGEPQESEVDAAVARLAHALGRDAAGEPVWAGSGRRADRWGGVDASAGDEQQEGGGDAGEGEADG